MLLFLKRSEKIVALGPFANAVGELKAPHTRIMLCWNAEPCLVNTAMIQSSFCSGPCALVLVSCRKRKYLLKTVGVAMGYGGFALLG